jgi:hypothetical protein
MKGLTPAKGSLAVLKSPGSKGQSLCGAEKFLCETAASAVFANSRRGRLLHIYSDSQAPAGESTCPPSSAWPHFRYHESGGRCPPYAAFQALRVSRRTMRSWLEKFVACRGRRPRLPSGGSCLTSGKGCSKFGGKPQAQGQRGNARIRKESSRGEGPARTAKARGKGNIP